MREHRKPLCLNVSTGHCRRAPRGTPYGWGLSDASADTLHERKAAPYLPTKRLRGRHRTSPESVSIVSGRERGSPIRADVCPRKPGPDTSPHPAHAQKAKRGSARCDGGASPKVQYGEAHANCAHRAKNESDSVRRLGQPRNQSNRKSECLGHAEVSIEIG